MIPTSWSRARRAGDRPRLVLPVLERYNRDTLKDFLMVFKFDRKVWDVL